MTTYKYIYEYVAANPDATWNDFVYDITFGHDHKLTRDEAIAEGEAYLSTLNGFHKIVRITEQVVREERLL